MEVVGGNGMSLEQIKEKLNECYKKRQPVLLFGRDDYGREKLVEEVHTWNVGIDTPPTEWEYQGDDERTKRIDGMREELRRLLTDPLGDIKRNKLYKGKRKDIVTNERICKLKDNFKYKYTDNGYENEFNEYMLDCNDTPRTYKYDDWSCKGGQAVSDDLSKFEYKRIDSGGEFKYDLLEVGSHAWRNHSDRCLFRKQYERSNTKRLLDYRGTLFINNLECDDPNDKKWYKRLAREIELLKETPQSQRGWLVFYLRYRSTFPSEFIEQFEPERLVLLDKDKLKKGSRSISSVTQFPTPIHTKWQEVEIVFIDNEHVNIRAKNIIRSSVHYSQMGFKFEKSMKKLKLWDTLRLFAMTNGTITPQIIEKGRIIKPVSVDDVKRLRVKLQSYFGISDNPIPKYDKGKYTKKKEGGSEFIEGEGYKTSFVIRDESASTNQKDKIIATADIDSDY
jgi:hypothetical protein